MGDSNTYKGATGQVLAITMPSRILSCAWDASVVAAGTRAGYRVDTQYVAEQSDLRLTFRDGNGKQVGTASGKVLNNVHRNGFQVPLNAATPLSFEVELPAHGIQSRSSPIPVVVLPSISQVQIVDPQSGQLANPLLEHQTYRIQARIASVPKGTDVVWTLLEQDDKGKQQKLASGICKVDGIQATAQVTLDYGDRAALLPTVEEAKRNDTKYANPTLVAVVGCLGVQASSDPVPLRQRMELRFWASPNQAGKFEGKTIQVVAPDQSKTSYTIPSDGTVVVETTLPGTYSVDLAEVADLL